MNAKSKYTDGVHEGRIKLMAELERLQGLEEPYNDEGYREPLCIDTRIEKDIVLSTGGPADGFKLIFSVDKELLSGVYYRADWGEYSESSLSEDEAEMVYHFYMGGVYE